MSKYNVIKWDKNLEMFTVIAVCSDYKTAKTVLLEIAEEQKINRIYLDIEIKHHRENLFCGGYLGA